MMDTEFEKEWETIQKDITKFRGILEGSRAKFTFQEYTTLKRKIYDMCVRPQHSFSQELYENCCHSFEDYITASVLPSLRQRHADELMLRELVSSWSNHKVLVQWFCKVFKYLEQCVSSVPTIKEVGDTRFRDLVYQEFKTEVRDAVIALINQERDALVYLIDLQWDGDLVLLKNVVDIFVEIGMGKMDCYEKDFEAPLLENTASYYSWVADCWIEVEACGVFLLKAENSIRFEKERVAPLLHPNSKTELLNVVQHELISVHGTRLLEDEGTGFLSLLKGEKKEDLSRLYTLFAGVPHGLEPVVTLFEQHINEEVAAHSGSDKEELREKFTSCVVECFRRDPRFDEAVNQAFIDEDEDHKYWCNLHLRPKGFLTLSAIRMHNETVHELMAEFFCGACGHCFKTVAEKEIHVREQRH